MNEKGLLTMSTKEVERLSTIQRVIDKKITQIIAAEHLDLTVRQIKRLVKLYKQQGASGLISKKRDQSSNRKNSDAQVAIIKQLIEAHYWNQWGQTRLICNCFR